LNTQYYVENKVKVQAKKIINKLALALTLFATFSIELCKSTEWFCPWKL